MWSGKSFDALSQVVFKFNVEDRLTGLFPALKDGNRVLLISKIRDHNEAR